MHFQMLVHRDKAYAKGRSITEKLKEVIPRQQFEIPIQACVGAKVIARETVKALRKDVLAKMLWWRYFEKKKAPRKTKRGQKTYEADWLCRSAIRSVYVRIENGLM